MRKVIGTGCILLGIACLLASLGLMIYNRQESRHAEESAQVVLRSLQAYMSRTAADTPQEETAEPEVTSSVAPEIPAISDCIGILSIPVLELELPVLRDWSYEKLKQAPCQYFGTCEEPDFVIAAHNYPAHFGNLSRLQPQDLVLFTDLNGTTHYYEVALLETLPPTATEEMITSGFDLSLYTCTPGGGSRVTARCREITP